MEDGSCSVGVVEEAFKGAAPTVGATSVEKEVGCSKAYCWTFLVCLCHAVQSGWLSTTIQRLEDRLREGVPQNRR